MIGMRQQSAPNSMRGRAGSSQSVNFIAALPLQGCHHREGRRMFWAVSGAEVYKKGKGFSVKRSIIYAAFLYTRVQPV